MKKQGKNKFIILQLLRIALLAAFSAVVTEIVTLGTPTIYLILLGAVGIIVSGSLVTREISSSKVAFWHAGLIILGFVTSYILEMLSPEAFGIENNHFIFYRYFQHIAILFGFYFVGFVSTWAFWKYSHSLTFEIITAASLLVWLLGGHRNYQLDSPKQITAIAWEFPIFQQFGLGPQHLLILIAFLATLLFTIYLFVASSRPLFNKQLKEVNYLGDRKSVKFAISLILLGSFGAYAYFLNQNYAASLSRSSNGVGLGSEEGKSPLGFHSAVGKTKQPAALVRLENDYSNNPWAPMLYIREGALSKFDGLEVVQATSNFDKDVPLVKPGGAFIYPGKEKPENRFEVAQSVYLLANHENSFAIDYPDSIRVIKNPDDDRFKFAYHAISNAPTEKLEELLYYPVGDNTWSKEVWAHYLRAPGSKTVTPETELPLDTSPGRDKFGEDLRYAQLSRQLTAGAKSPLEKATQIVNYLSEDSIYTRAPGHEVPDNGDPVAPYLFSKPMKGYCVHFAHAAVYLMRLAGIPSRIGTGYLTDLTYAKDGHILLHLGDRHAWPELYIDGVGWVVVDITPAQAEGEEEIIPDENLLEDLMSKIDPSFELMDPLETEDLRTPPKKSIFLGEILKAKHLFNFGLAILTLTLLAKLYLWFAWLVTSNPNRKASLAYLSMKSRLADLGVSREYGETRQEFSRRLLVEKGIDGSSITKIKELEVYSKNNANQVEEIKAAMEKWNASFSEKYKLPLRIISFLSPGAFFKIFR